MLGQVDHPLVEAAALKVLDAARRAGVAAGTISLDPATIRRRLEQGFRFMAVATDGSLLTNGARQLLEVVRD
jgi:2-keto-3-deoxy-L-rhamnonate aldolase RhmA